MPRTAALLALVLALPASAADPKPERVLLLRYKQDTSGNRPSTAELIAVDPNTKAVTVLTPKPFGALYGAPLALSPDGTRVAYQRADGKDRYPPASIHVQDVSDPKAKSKLLTVRGEAVCWTPDNKAVVVVESTRERTVHHLVSFDTLETKEIELPKVEKPKDGKGRSGHVILDVSPDGKHWLTKTIAGVYGERSTGLFLVPRAGGEAKALEGAWKGLRGRFSPDGATILYVIESRDGGALFYTVPATGGKTTPILIRKSDHGETAQHAVSSFAWSPDGKRIVYSASLQTNPRSELSIPVVVIASADGKDPKVLLRSTTFTEQFYSPVWR